MDEGRKDDVGKPEMYLLPPKALLDVGKNLTHGKYKYSADNWKNVPDLKDRYISAALRHIMYHLSGEEKDSDSDTYHLSCAVSSLLFVVEDIINKKEIAWNPDNNTFIGREPLVVTPNDLIL